MRRPVFWAVLLTYLLISFVPQLGLMSLIGKGKRRKG